MSTQSDLITAPLVPVVLDQVHVIRRLQTSVSALREALQVAISMLASKDKQIDRLRQQNARLRDEVQTLTTQQGQTCEAA